MGIRQHGGTFRPYYPIWAGDVWTAENPDAAYPRVVGSNWQESGTGVSSFWIRNGAYLRLRDLNISYSLPQSVTNAMKIKNVSVFFNGTNLFVFSPMTEFHDPEQKMYDSYPVMKTFALGLDVKF
ncbi:TonB-dependent receptor [Sphingobacterium spiritivorum]|uniref:TonB-dependent receptor n=1 Tax=Sphingobacterium spiritivorum TaxID=258 RepID=UPI0021CF1FFD|nr:TonB-dependent receptor [Sphingobacterium spiritivorum]